MHLRFLQICIAIIYFGTFANNAQGIIPIVHKENSTYTFSESNIGYLEDTTSVITIYDLLAPDTTYTFTPIDNSLSFKGYTYSAFWLKIDIRNTTKLYAHYYLSIDYPLLGDVRMFTVEDSLLKDIYITGIQYPFSKREIFDRFFVFPLKINPHTEHSFYIRILNIGNVTNIPVSIKPHNNPELQDITMNFKNALYYGYILFASIFFILMWIGLKKIYFAFLAMYSLSSAILLAIYDGYVFWFFMPNFAYISHTVLNFLSLLSIAMIAQFANYFLRNISLVIKTLNIFLIIASLLFVWSILPPPHNEWSYWGINLFILSVFVFLTIVGWVKFFIHKTIHKFLFALSTSIVFITLGLAFAENFSLFTFLFTTNQSFKIGFALQITLLTIATISAFKESLIKSNIKLETLVEKRTNVIKAKNEQLEIQNLKISSQVAEIKQSLRYAKQLQNAILPSKYKFSSVFKEHFIFYKPRDIVSGDFYWISEKNNNTYIVTADCTGHGMHGALLSMLGISFLNQIVQVNHGISPNILLNKLSILLSETFPNQPEFSAHDDMVISVCLFDSTRNTIQYAGAYSPLYIVRNKKLTIINGEKIPLAVRDSDAANYSNKTIQLQTGDALYMFSDGFSDQFGGERNKRLTKKRFREMILTYCDTSMSMQRIKFEEYFTNWKGDIEQVDDILLLGFKIP